MATKELPEKSIPQIQAIIEEADAAHDAAFAKGEYPGDWYTFIAKAVADAGYINLEDWFMLITEYALVWHQRVSIGACGCGWSELGKSHARHQAQQIRKALREGVEVPH